MGVLLGFEEGLLDGTSVGASVVSGTEKISKSCPGILKLRSVSSRPSNTSKSCSAGIDMLMLNSVSTGDGEGSEDGLIDGVMVGLSMGEVVGELLGFDEGFADGSSVGGSVDFGIENSPASSAGILMLKSVSSKPSNSSKSCSAGIDMLILNSVSLGDEVCLADGLIDGVMVGLSMGEVVGELLGFKEGLADGSSVGASVLSSAPFGNEKSSKSSSGKLKLISVSPNPKSSSKGIDISVSANVGALVTVECDPVGLSMGVPLGAWVGSSELIVGATVVSGSVGIENSSKSSSGKLKLASFSSPKSSSKGKDIVISAAVGASDGLKEGEAVGFSTGATLSFAEGEIEGMEVNTSSDMENSSKSSGGILRLASISPASVIDIENSSSTAGTLKLDSTSPTSVFGIETFSSSFIEKLSNPSTCILILISPGTDTSGREMLLGVPEGEIVGLPIGELLGFNVGEPDGLAEGEIVG